MNGSRKKQPSPGIYRFEDLSWKKERLARTSFRSKQEAHSLKRSIKHSVMSVLRRRQDRFISPVLLSTADGGGKITDCGYDMFDCLFTKIPCSCDMVFSADISVCSFLEPGHITYQEGFGLFLRDTMELDPETGFPYSNMMAVGGYYGGWNCFGRSGVLENDIDNIKNCFLYGRQSCCDPFQVFPDSPRALHLTLERRGSGIRADMTDGSGRHLLCPDGTRTPGTGGFSLPGDGSCLLHVSDTLFFQRDPKYLYLGFFAAGCRISVDLGSVELTLTERPSSSGVKAPLFASPDGSCMGFGTREAPYDLATAIRQCREGQEVRALPGRYLLKEDLIIEKTNRGTRDCPKTLKGPKKGKAVLDFGGSPHALYVLGSFWIIDGLTVTHGFGIRIQGDHNHIVNCTAENNLETGILIRHERNDSPKEEWPSYNTVEECVSRFNCDAAGCNADGFACKVASGKGNRFVNCVSYMNADDGFDLFTKNRKIGPVELIGCKSFLNGYDHVNGASLHPSNGNGNGFKLGGSGLAVNHCVIRCEAFGNKGSGFTSNSNPQMNLLCCRSEDNMGPNYLFDFSGRNSAVKYSLTDCTDKNTEGFDPLALLEKISRNEE
ncbi:MAG: right-handed parallel beta-helix repeat-containing protein [Clostridiales bacterium]|nr:right-handed parallel beta-helix repeat-containing protein [Clostridiales bacterium]